MRKWITIFVLSCTLFLTGAQSNCHWEQNTYNTLSSAKATIDCASAGYNHDDVQITKYCVGATNPSALYLPQTSQVHDILAKAEIGRAHV